MTGFKGIAGEKMEVGQFVYRGPDGKFYLSAGQVTLAGVAAEPIDAGQEFTDDDYNGHFRPVNKQTK